MALLQTLPPKEVVKRLVDDIFGINIKQTIHTWGTYSKPNIEGIISYCLDYLRVFGCSDIDIKISENYISIFHRCEYIFVTKRQCSIKAQQLIRYIEYYRDIFTHNNIFKYNTYIASLISREQIIETFLTNFLVECSTRTNGSFLVDGITVVLGVLSNILQEILIKNRKEWKISSDFFLKLYEDLSNKNCIELLRSKKSFSYVSTYS